MHQYVFKRMSVGKQVFVRFCQFISLIFGCLSDGFRNPYLLAGTDDDGIQVFVHLQHQVFFLDCKWDNLSGKQKFLVFLAELFPQYLIGNGQCFFTVEHGYAVFTEPQLALLAVNLHHVRQDAFLQSRPFTVKDVPVLMGVLV